MKENRFIKNSLLKTLMWILVATYLFLLFMQNQAQAKEPEEIAMQVPWNIHFYAVPGSDGNAIAIFTGQTTQLNGMVDAHVGIGGPPVKHSEANFNEVNQTYEMFVDIFAPEGTISLSAELDNGTMYTTPDVSFQGYSVPLSYTTSLLSDDNNFQMTINSNTFDTDLYALVMATNALPGDLPTGHHLVGSPYSARLSSAVVTSTQAVALEIFYSDAILGNVEPHTLSILQWDSTNRIWETLDGELYHNNANPPLAKWVSATTNRFSVYVLATTPNWHDPFNSYTGLSTWNETSVTGGKLALNSTALSGQAISRIFTPTGVLREWGTITYQKNTPTNSNVSVDVLDANGNVILANVSSGTSLASLNPALYPSLKLQATLSRNDTIIPTPSLDEWHISTTVSTCYPQDSNCDGAISLSEIEGFSIPTNQVDFADASQALDTFFETLNEPNPPISFSTISKALDAFFAN